MQPRVGEARLVVLARLRVIEADLVGDIVLLEDGEAGALHRRRHQPLEKLGGQLVRVSAHLDEVLEVPNQIQAGLEHGFALADGDHLGLVPWELLEGADHRLIRALRAHFGVGRLDRKRGRSHD